MDSLVTGKLLIERKCPTIPLFLQTKHATNKQLPEKRLKKIANASKQFQEFIFIDEKNKSSIRKRVSLPIKYTPKIIILEQQQQKLTALIQCPKKLFTQNLKPFRKSVQVQRIYQIIESLFQLVQVYGYFYCDKQLLRVSQNGFPVIWVHEKFQQNQRLFPIRPSSVSEIIFIKKVIETFSNFIFFPSQIATKEQIMSFLWSQKLKNNATQIYFPTSPSRKTSGIPIKTQPKIRQRKPSLVKIQLPKNISPLKFTPTISARQVKQSKKFDVKLCLSKQKDIDKMSQNPRRNSKKIHEFFQINQERTKTTKFQPSKNSLDISLQSKNQQSEILHKSKNSSINIQIKLKTVQNLKLSNKTELNELEQASLFDQFNFQQQTIQKNTNLRHERTKSRKQSADVNLTNSWLQKNQKMLEAKFPNSTFSTRMTFSSLKGLLQNTHQNQSKQNKIQIKNQNHCLPHLYCIQKQKQIKQKLTAEMKKIMKQSGMKISQEDSFENQVQNLLDSSITQQQKKRKITKQSSLMVEFEKLFNSSKCQETDQEVDIKQMQNILF